MPRRIRYSRSTKKFLRRFYFILAVLLLTVSIVYNPISVRVMTIGVAVYYRINPVIFYRLIKAESAFRSLAVSHRNAIGLGQIRQSTAHYIKSDHEPKLLYSPLYNLKVSAQYIIYLRKRFDNNWSLVLAAYNWGETNVSHRMLGKKIDPNEDYRERFRDVPETYGYIEKILGSAKKT